MEDVLFSDLIQINPKVELKKGDVYPFVEMGEVEPGKRYVYGRQLRSFSGGGAKFKTGDILFARITPCLENGKIAQFNSTGKTGFGSTEFFVFRAIHGIADPGYVYYLSMSDIIKQPAIKSMSGASGRQRADLESTTNTQVPYNPLPNQRKIAAILTAYDDLIENNLRRIKILEEMAQLIYREWFVHFRFPGHEKVKMVDSPLGKIPEGWEAVKLGDLITVRKGKSITKKTIVAGKVPVVAGGIEPAYYHNVANTLKPVITISASGANSGFIRLYHENVWASDCSFIDMNVSKYVYYFYLQLKNRQTEVTGLQRGSAQPHVYPKDIMELDTVKVPVEILDNFSGNISPYFALIGNLLSSNLILRQTRDLLLPKLISGELDVSDLDITLPEVVSA